MIFKNLSFLVLWTKVDSALEGLIKGPMLSFHQGHTPFRNTRVLATTLCRKDHLMIANNFFPFGEELNYFAKGAIRLHYQIATLAQHGSPSDRSLYSLYLYLGKVESTFPSPPCGGGGNYKVFSF